MAEPGEEPEEGLIDNYEKMWEIEYDELEMGNAIGKGAFGQVFAGLWLGTDVAVKKLSSDDRTDREELKYLDRELALLKTVRHPNILTFMGTAKKDNDVYIVTELCKHGDLRKLLKGKEKISWPTRISMSLDIARAMAYLHSRNILFRDLKGKNILVGDHKCAKVCDFGLARMTKGRGVKKAMTLCGTEEYMPPEIILGMDYDEKADVFSFGILMFEIITREKVSVALQRSPMDAFDLDEAKTRALLPKECPSEFAELAFACCRYDPGPRPAFKEVVKELRDMYTVEKAKEDEHKAKHKGETNGVDAQNVEQWANQAQQPQQQAFGGGWGRGGARGQRARGRARGARGFPRGRGGQPPGGGFRGRGAPRGRGGPPGGSPGGPPQPQPKE